MSHVAKKLAINKIYCMDCCDFLEQLNDGIADLAVIDPPYFLEKDKWDCFLSFNEFLDFTYNWIDRLIPKIKDVGSLYIFNTPLNASFILQYLLKKGLFFQNWITWDKRDGFSASKYKYANGQETILFFTKSKKYVFNADDIRIPYESKKRILHAAKKGILKNGKRWFPNPKGKLCNDIWHITSERHKNKINGKTLRLPHATPKPLEMMERIIRASSNPKDLILDCFMGTGTTALAAKKLCRNYIGCDNSKEYVQTAKKRLRNGSFF